MFISHNQVRMHDTDMAGILYFSRQFRFAHDALEDFMEHLGYTFHQVFEKEEFIFVVVHAESDYLAPLHVTDKLTVHVSVAHLGTSSFTMQYDIYNKDQVLVGRAQTVHVTLHSKQRKKIAIPSKFRELLQQHVQEHVKN